jgi:hypothetical protein
MVDIGGHLFTVMALEDTCFSALKSYALLCALVDIAASGGLNKRMIRYDYMCYKSSMKN